ncbi:MAG: hypothetical protein KAG92_00815, partial [Deltaproteobacteria bacterium]|nr:hypothetical protein [Deltaproteobacteria bacterium]
MEQQSMNNSQTARKAKIGLFDKLLILHLLSIILIFIFVVIAYSQLQANNFSRAFVDKSTLIRELLETTCIDPVVNTIAYDRTSKIIEALYRKNRSIAYIEIYDPTARIISSIGMSPDNPFTAEQIEHQFNQKPGSGAHSTLNLKETEFITPLSANGSTLGLVRVGMTKTYLQQQLKRSVLYFLGIFLVAISLTSLLYYYFTKRWILKPIIKLGTLMKSYRQDDLYKLNEEIFVYNENQGKDEIGIMSHAFGQMVFSIT